MPERPALTSSEVATLWMTYQQKTMIMQMLDYFVEKADDERASAILTDLRRQVEPIVARIADIFRQEGAAVPVGFTPQDVNVGAPKLYDNGFDIMFVRLIKEISMAMHTLNITMAYREDIIALYRELTALTQSVYQSCTNYLVEKGMAARPPYVSMPTSAVFVKDTAYLGGLAINPFSDKRTLNAVEVAHIHHAIESNVTGMQMITGFAQCANDPEVKSYFTDGAELAKSIIKELSELLLQSGVQAPVASGGHATRSTSAPFSDKIMMYCTSLFCSFSIGNNSLGTAFSLRNDLPVKMTAFVKDIYEYAHKGAKLMIKNGWMEEPPQMEQRKELVGSKG